MSKNKPKRDELSETEYLKRLTVATASAMYQSRWLSDYAEQIMYCGTYIQFKDDKLIGANFCRHRLCPLCQKRKSLRQYSKIQHIVDNLGGKYKFLHLVLTVRNCEADQLTETINRLFKASRSLFNDRTVKRAFKGVLRCLEVSYNSKCKTFHPHLHCLVAVLPSYFTSRYYLPKVVIAGLWRKYLGADYTPQISIGPIDDNGIAEVAKYSLKPLELDLPIAEHAAVLLALHQALHGRRLLQFYGCLREYARLLADDETESEVVNSDDVTKYSYDFGSLKYLKI